MKRSPILADHIRETEVIGGVGAARLLQWLDGKFEIRGGSDEERKQLREWADTHLTSNKEIRWHVPPNVRHGRDNNSI